MIKPALLASLLLLPPLRAQQPPTHPSDHPAGGSISAADLARVRRATARFANPDTAAAAGFAPVATVCISDSSLGGMGFHATNRQNLDGRLEPEHPAFLVFEKLADGRMALNAVEYAVPYRIWAPDSLPPTLFGQTLNRSDGLKLWYLHVWAFHDNRSGVFANYSAQVVCRP